MVLVMLLVIVVNNVTKMNVIRNIGLLIKALHVLRHHVHFLRLFKVAVFLPQLNIILHRSWMQIQLKTFGD